MGLQSEPTPTSVGLAGVILQFSTPLFSELALLVRVVAAYPPPQLAPPLRVALYGTIASWKLARLGNIIAVWVAFCKLPSQNNLAWENALGNVIVNLPSWRVEWFMHTFDITLSLSSSVVGKARVLKLGMDLRFISILFLARIYMSTRDSRKAGILSVSRNEMRRGRGCEQLNAY